MRWNYEMVTKVRSADVAIINSLVLIESFYQRPRAAQIIIDKYKTNSNKMVERQMNPNHFHIVPREP